MTPKAVYDPTRQRSAECSKCRALIVFRFNTTSGKESPWDMQRCSGCRAEIVDPPHAISFISNASKQSTARCDGSGWVFTSHFATCPFADDFRRPK